MTQRSTRKGLSRRSVIGTVGATTLMVESISALAQPPALDPILTIGDRWQAMGREEADLSLRWSNVESWLIENFGWADLSDEEQQALPEAQQLHEIDAQLAELGEQQRSIRTQLLDTPATTLEGTILKLRIVADTITAVDNWTAHHLIVAAIDELTALAASDKTG